MCVWLGVLLAGVRGAATHIACARRPSNTSSSRQRASDDLQLHHFQRSCKNKQALPSWRVCGSCRRRQLSSRGFTTGTHPRGTSAVAVHTSPSLQVSGTAAAASQLPAGAGEVRKGMSRCDGGVTWLGRLLAMLQSALLAALTRWPAAASCWGRSGEERRSRPARWSFRLEALPPQRPRAAAAAAAIWRLAAQASRASAILRQLPRARARLRTERLSLAHDRDLLTKGHVVGQRELDLGLGARGGGRRVAAPALRLEAAHHGKARAGGRGAVGRQPRRLLPRDVDAGHDVAPVRGLCAALALSRLLARAP